MKNIKTVGLCLALSGGFAGVSAKEVSVLGFAGVCAGYHMGYAMISNSTGARNDRDHSVRVVSQLDSQYGSSSSTSK